MQNEMLNGNFYPTILNDEVKLEDYKKVPFDDVPLIAAGLSSITDSFCNVSKMTANSGGLFRMVIPDGATGTLVMKNGVTIGNFVGDDGHTFSARARFVKVNDLSGVASSFNPALLFMAVGLHSVKEKADECIQIGQDIMHYLEQKEKSEVIGSVKFLTDTLNHYGFNWNNKRYIESNLTVVLDIRKQAEQSITFHKMRIEEQLEKNPKFHHDNDVSKKFNSIVASLRNYQLSLYMLSFSSFLEVLLEENFESGYLNAIIDKINNHSLEYRMTYTNCYDFIETYSDSSLQTHLISGAAKIGKISGKAIAKIPIISKTQIDENLIALGEKLNTSTGKRTQKTMNQFIKMRNDNTTPFVENIQSIEKVFNNKIELIFNSKNLYYRL
jgi:hypothetical protein